MISDQLSIEVKLVFDDVSEEFSQISTILDKFEEWRRNDFETYKDTYFNLCLPKVFMNALFCHHLLEIVHILFLDFRAYGTLKPSHLESS